MRSWEDLKKLAAIEQYDDQEITLTKGEFRAYFETKWGPFWFGFFVAATISALIGLAVIKG